MFGSKYIALALAAFSTLTLSAPTKHASVKASPKDVMHTASAPSSKRQLDIAADILSIVDSVFDIVSSIDDAQHDQEGAFTQQTVADLAAQYPTYNILVYHDQDSGFEYVNGYHQHVELELVDGLGTTKGYEVWVFESGTFSLAGDGGFENWCFQGYWDEPEEGYVEFYSMMS